MTITYCHHIPHSSLLGLISAAGPLVGLMSCVIFPLIWSLPVALVTAELCCLFPENGGYSLWVNEAFGPFWAFQESYWSWTSGVVDNATYPVMFYASLRHLIIGIQVDDCPLSLHFHSRQYFVVGPKKFYSSACFTSKYCSKVPRFFLPLL
jgi:amino acid transporter